MCFKVYIMYSSKLDRYYTGSCENIDLRISQHNSGRNLSTKSGMPWEIKYIEQYVTRPEAQTCEMEIKKKKSRKYIEWLISSVG